VSKKKNSIQLPEGIQVIGLSQEQAARCWGVSPNHFTTLEKMTGLVPRARRAGDRKLYSWIELQEGFHKLPFWNDEGDDPEDEWRVN
jgi:hypothetical protein